VQREVWNYRNAAWGDLKAEVTNSSWFILMTTRYRLTKQLASGHVLFWKPLKITLANIFSMKRSARALGSKAMSLLRLKHAPPPMIVVTRGNESWSAAESCHRPTMTG